MRGCLRKRHDPRSGPSHRGREAVGHHETAVRECGGAGVRGAEGRGGAVDVGPRSFDRWHELKLALLYASSSPGRRMPRDGWFDRREGIRAKRPSGARTRCPKTGRAVKPRTARLADPERGVQGPREGSAGVGGEAPSSIRVWLGGRDSRRPLFGFRPGLATARQLIRSLTLSHDLCFRRLSAFPHDLPVLPHRCHSKCHSPSAWSSSRSSRPGVGFSKPLQSLQQQ